MSRSLTQETGGSTPTLTVSRNVVPERYLSAMSATSGRPSDGVAGDAIANARRGPADKAIAHSGRSLRPVLGIVGVLVLLHDGVDDSLSDVDHELADPGAGAVELSAGDPFVAIRNP